MIQIDWINTFGDMETVPSVYTHEYYPSIPEYTWTIFRKHTVLKQVVTDHWFLHVYKCIYEIVYSICS